MYCSVAGDRLPLIRKHQEMSQVVFRINLFTTSLCSLAIFVIVYCSHQAAYLSRNAKTQKMIQFTEHLVSYFSPLFC